MNPPDLLLHLVGYHYSFGFGGKILIGDSTTADTSTQIAESIASHSGIHCI